MGRQGHVGGGRLAVVLSRPAESARALSRAPRGTLLVHVLLAALVLSLAGWGLDWGARVGAQSVIAHTVQRAEHLAQRPSVTVHGWFFLPQVVTGGYGQVDVTVHGLRDGALRLDTVSATLYGVHVPVHDVVTGDVDAVLVDRARERVLLIYPDLNRYLAAQGHPLSLSSGAPGQVRITAHVELFGRSLAVSADAVVRTGPGHLDIVPTSLHTGTTLLDAASEQLLDRRLTVQIPTAPLPFGQKVTAVHPGPTGLTVLATGEHLVLGRPVRNH